jgi:restriction system protein
MSDLLIIAAAAGAFYAARRYRKKRAFARVVRAAEDACDMHQAALVQAYIQTVHKDEFGVPQVDEIMNRVNYFVDAVVAPRVRGDLRIIGGVEAYDDLADIVFDRLLAVHLPAYDETVAAMPDKVAPLHARDFEVWVAQHMSAKGWDARVCGRSGDQGADIIARSEELGVYVVQCKRWAEPVDNSAVQEVAAARAHYGADGAAVVSTSGYTKSARQLAATNDVVLLDSITIAEGFWNGPQ